MIGPDTHPRPEKKNSSSPRSTIKQTEALSGSEARLQQRQKGLEMNRNTALLALVVALLGATPVFAHGWTIPPTPPYSPTGGGGPEYQGAVGGGEGIVPEVEPTGGTATPQPQGPQGPNYRFGTRTTPKLATRVSRPTAPTRRPKTARSPWLKNISVPWQAVFAPVAENGTYAKTQQNPLAGVMLSAEQGGWERSKARALVLVLDPSKKSHLKSLKALESDSRFVAAANLFDCYRVDARSLKKAPSSPTLSAFDAKGNLVGQLKGRTLRKGFELAEKAWGKKMTTKVQAAHAHLGGIAYYEQHIEKLEKAIICPDCGHERNDVARRLETLKLRRDAHKKGIASLDD